MLRYAYSKLVTISRIFLVALAMIGGLTLPTPAGASTDPTQGPGGPILVVTSASSTFSKYYAEILRTEGLNEFAVADISTVTPAVLSGYDVEIGRAHV